MKVYIVSADTPVGHILFGVFSSMEKAKECMDEEYADTITECEVDGYFE